MRIDINMENGPNGPVLRAVAVCDEITYRSEWTPQMVNGELPLAAFLESFGRGLIKTFGQDKVKADLLIFD